MSSVSSFFSPKKKFFSTPSQIRYDPGGWFSRPSRWWRSLGLSFVLPMFSSLWALKLLAAQTKYSDSVFMEEDEPIEPAGPMTPKTPDGLSVSPSGEVVGGVTYPCSVQRGIWAEPFASKFNVRGPSYLTDAVKVPAAPAFFHLVAVDCNAYATPEERVHVCRRKDSLVWQKSEIEKRGLPDPFFFVINMLVSSPKIKNIALTLYFHAVDPKWQDQHNPFTDLLTDFIEGDNDFRNKRFKMIPHLVEGPFVLRHLLKPRPVLVGMKKLTIHYNKGPNYFEVGTV